MSSDYIATASRHSRERQSYSDASVAHSDGHDTSASSSSRHAPHQPHRQQPPSPHHHTTDDGAYPTDNQGYALTPPASPSVFAPASAVPTIGVSPPNAAYAGEPTDSIQLQPYGAPYPVTTCLSMVPASGAMQLLSPSSYHHGAMTPSYRSSSSNLISPVFSPRTPRHHLAAGASADAAHLAAGSTGSLAREPSGDILLQEISRLRHRLNTLETENATMSIKLNQQQWEVEQRLSEIEMQICGSESGGSGASDDGKGNKESVI